MKTVRRNNFIELVLLFTLTLPLVIPTPIFAQTTLPVHVKSGPYVDKLLFKIFTQDDQKVLALQDDEIDIIGDWIDPTFLRTLQEANDIEISNTLRNGYGYFTINCAKYPFNITAFRRALAFALDKKAISEEVWSGQSEPLDSCIPKCNPFSIEGQLPYSYYSANIEMGNYLLDQAGFEINETTGYRMAPDGSIFDVLIESAQTSSIGIGAGDLVEEALNALNINATSFPTDIYEYLNRLYFHGDYDIVFLGNSFTNFDVDWLAYEFWSEYADEPYWNFPNFANASYDSWREQLLHATDYDAVYEAAIEMQKVWVYQCPEIICYENTLLSAYRTDKFEGYINHASDGVPGWWTNYKVHLKDELGGTLRWSNALDIGSFNIFTIYGRYSMNILEMLYDSLIKVGPDGKNILWLAEKYEIETHNDNPNIPDGHTRFTFDILQNATWSDGMPLAAEDIAFSFNYYRNIENSTYSRRLENMTAVYARTQQKAVVEFDTESYWHLHTVGYLPIIPKHVFEVVGIEGWNRWNPRPPEEPMVTSGPFNVSDYVAGEYTELTRNPGYFYATLWPPAEDPSTLTTGNPNGNNPSNPFEYFIEGTSNLSIISWGITIPSIAIIVVVLVKWRTETK